jgi:hypothetical protein
LVQIQPPPPADPLAIRHFEPEKPQKSGFDDAGRDLIALSGTGTTDDETNKMAEAARTRQQPLVRSYHRHPCAGGRWRTIA